MVDILPGDDARAMIRERMKSREWWTIVHEGASASAWIQKLEADFYSGLHSADFELVAFAIPGRPGAVIAFARKSVLPAEKLEAVLYSTMQYLVAPVATPDLYRQDVIFMAEHDAQGLARWLQQVYKGDQGG